jgi:hypothetical protein
MCFLFVHGINNLYKYLMSEVLAMTPEETQSISSTVIGRNAKRRGTQRIRGISESAGLLKKRKKKRESDLIYNPDGM